MLESTNRIDITDSLTHKKRHGMTLLVYEQGNRGVYLSKLDSGEYRVQVGIGSACIAYNCITAELALSAFDKECKLIEVTNE